MRKQQSDVHEFHAKHGFPSGRKLSEECSVVDGSGIKASTGLMNLGRAVLMLAKGLVPDAIRYSNEGDDRCFRAQHLLEETAESIIALANRDEDELGDALGDLLYVTLGTGDTYSIPLEDVFEEVHSSNMTKKQRTPDNPRMRDKGEDYVPPDIHKAIAHGRQNNGSDHEGSR